MDSKILVPVDDSKTADRTIQAIIALKERFPLPLTLLHVVDLEKLAYRMIPDFQIDMIREQARKAGEHLLESRRKLFAEAGMDTETRLEFGSPRELICRIANEENFQLLIIGRRSQGEIRDVLFGSVANHALHHVRCPVLLF
jgi:nucleotide-binding universal stress UspA family protein